MSSPGRRSSALPNLSDSIAGSSPLVLFNLLCPLFQFMDAGRIAFTVSFKFSPSSVTLPNDFIWKHKPLLRPTSASGIAWISAGHYALTAPFESVISFQPDYPLKAVLCLF
ncbi:MAG: hypothetical protein RJA81_1675 [Planctomycetota bacterium]